MPETNGSQPKAPSASSPIPGAKIWASILEHLKSNVNTLSFNTWLKPTRAVRGDNGSLIIEVPNDEFREWIETHYGTQIREALGSLPLPFGQSDFPTDVKYRCAIAAPSKVAAEAKKKSTTADRYPELPDEAWYGLAKTYRQAVADCTEASDVFHFACWMSAAGALVGRNVFYKSPDPVYPNLYILLIGRSGGSRKGSAMGLATKFVHDVSAPLRPLSSIDSWQGLLRKMQARQASDSENQAMPLATILRLAEFKSLIKKAQRRGTADIFPGLNDAYDGPEYLEDNISRDSISVRNGLLVMQAGTQESCVDHLNEEDLLEGIGNRLTYWPGQKKPRKPRTPDPDPAIWNGLVKEVKEIHAFWQKRGPTRLDWTNEAGEAWDKYYGSLDDMLKEDPLIQTLREREHTNCLKMAMIHAALERSDRIAASHLRAAIVAAEFQHRAIIALFETFGASRWVKDERRIVEIVKAAFPEAIRARDVQRKFPRMSGEHFQRHVRWLTVQDGPLYKFSEGRREFLVWNE